MNPPHGFCRHALCNLTGREEQLHRPSGTADHGRGEGVGEEVRPWTLPQQVDERFRTNRVTTWHDKQIESELVSLPSPRERPKPTHEESLTSTRGPETDNVTLCPVKCFKQQTVLMKTYQLLHPALSPGWSLQCELCPWLPAARLFLCKSQREDSSVWAAAGFYSFYFKQNVTAKMTKTLESQRDFKTCRQVKDDESVKVKIVFL